MEHKIYYKYNKDVPSLIQEGLRDAATQAAELDRKMESLNEEINILKEQDAEENQHLTPELLMQFAQRLLKQK